MFTGAVLLVALIIFNSQENKHSTQGADTPDIEQIELLAEVYSNPFTGSTIPSYRLTVVVSKSFSGNLNHSEYQHFASHQTLFIAQKHLYLELKSDLEFQSGQYLHYHPRFGDPPVA